jgi:hypothetical protein
MLPAASLISVPVHRKHRPRFHWRADLDRATLTIYSRVTAEASMAKSVLYRGEMTELLALPNLLDNKEVFL